jgi:shikimate dehydrogenase
VRCAVLGDPIAHSLSPAMHRAAYDALGLDWSYDAIRVPAGTLAGFVEGLDDSWRGLSLTMPLKREAVPLLDTSDDWVKLTGAANTVVMPAAGRRLGLNTDVPGAVSAVGEHTDASFRHAVILGAGATAASMVLALAELGLERATILVRDPNRARETVRVLSAAPHRLTVTVDSLEPAAARSAGADIVVSTVPASAQVPELVAALAEVSVVFDVVYDPWPTPLAAAAAADGRTLVSGLDLLVAQARGQVEAMTGANAVPIDVMRAAAERALADRGAG